MINPQLGYSFTDWLGITRIPKCKTFYAHQNACPRSNVM